MLVEKVCVGKRRCADELIQLRVRNVFRKGGQQA